MITGEPSSSIPSVSIRPPWSLPVLYSESRKRTPRKASRCCSIKRCSGLSRGELCPGSSAAVPAPYRKRDSSPTVRHRLSLTIYLSHGRTHPNPAGELLGNRGELHQRRLKIFNDLLGDHLRRRQI